MESREGVEGRKGREEMEEGRRKMQKAMEGTRGGETERKWGDEWGEGREGKGRKIRKQFRGQAQEKVSEWIVEQRRVGIKVQNPKCKYSSSVL